MLRMIWFLHRGGEMRIIKIFFIAFFLCIFLQNVESYADYNIDFNYYVNSEENDFSYHFVQWSNYQQVPNNGITGGALIPIIYGSYGNDTAQLKSTVSNFYGKTHIISMSFLYDSSLSNPNYYNTLLQFWLNGDDSNHHLSGEIRGTGTDLRVNISGYYDGSFNLHPDKPTFTLSDNTWYNFKFTVSNIGGASGQIETEVHLYSLGETGLESPTLIDSDIMATYDVFFADTNNLQLNIYSEQWGGASALDNFYVNAPAPIPIANAGPDQVVFDRVVLDGSSSYSFLGDITEYQWELKHRDNSLNNRIVYGMIQTVYGLNKGFYDVTLKITDTAGYQNMDTAVLAVAGNKVVVIPLF